MVVHFHLHWWVSPIISHSVLPFASGHMCREHKKTRCLVSLWGTGFPCSRDKCSLLATMIFLFRFDEGTQFPKLPPAEHSDYTLGFLKSPSALSRLFWQPSLGDVSNQFSLHQTPMWESDMHTTDVYRQNKSQGLYGKHDGMELSLEFLWCKVFSFLKLVFFGPLFVKQCRVEETLTKPFFLLIGLVMFFNIANLDAK